MSDLNNVTITKSTGGLGRKNKSEDSIFGLMTTGPAPAGLPLDTSRLYLSIEQLEADGITPAYDTANLVLVHYHASEFFRMAPDAQLWLRIKEQKTGATFNSQAILVDKALSNAKSLLNDAEGKIKVLMINFNPDPTYAPVLAGGIDDNVTAAIPLAQALATEEFEEHKPVDILIEGRSFNGTAAAADDLRANVAPNVSVVIAQDPVIAALEVVHQGHAAIGTLGGTVAAAKVNENVGWLDKFNLADAATGRFLSANLSNFLDHKTFSTTDLKALQDKGYIFARIVTDFDGVYFNDSSTCVERADDFAFIENNRTINKAARLVRIQLLPKVSGPLLIDPDNGQLDQSTVNSFNADAEKALDPMERDEEISGKRIFTDPQQNVLATSKVEVKIKVTPVGVGREIGVTLGFDNPAIT